MAFTYSFIDNAVYGTDDINDIAKSLTGAGIAPFVSKDSYSASDLNTLTAELVETGVSLEGCRVKAENPATTEMTVTVAQGIVFFENGARLTVDAEGYALAVTPNTAGYIYAYFNQALQKAGIAFESELPQDGEYVLLAELSENGELTDKRTFARSKIATMGKNVTLNMHFSNMEHTLIRTEGNTSFYAVAHIQGVDLSNFNYVMLVCGSLTGTEEYLPTISFYSLAEDKGLISSADGLNTIKSGSWFLTGINYSLYYCLETFGGELCIVAQCTDSSKKSILKDFSAYTAMFM